MDDLISRAWLLSEYDKRHKGQPGGARKLIEEAPSAEEESFEWCTGCKEYDQEAHCCHRWSKMIRKTVEEMQVVRCKDCIYADYMDDIKTFWCTESGQGRTVAPYDFAVMGKGEMMDDLISRQAAIDALKGCYCGGEDSCGEPWIYEDHAIKAIEQLPSAQPKRGRWISADAIFGGVPFYCSECGENTWDTVMGKPRWKFCPMCGSRNEVTE